MFSLASLRSSQSGICEPVTTTGSRPGSRNASAEDVTPSFGTVQHDKSIVGVMLAGDVPGDSHPV